MYRLVQKISDLYGFIYRDNCIYTNRKNLERFQELSLSGEVLWQSKEDNIAHYYVNDKVIIFNLDDGNPDQFFDDLLIYNRRTKEVIFEGKMDLYLLAYECYEGNILYEINDDNIILFDISKGKILEKKDAITKGITAIITEKFVVKEDGIYIYIYIKNDFSLLWQKDLSEITSYTDWDGKHQGNVKNVYLYENKLIVVAGNSVLGMDIENGTILWQIKYNDFQPFTLHINNHFAYLSKGTFYSVIDLEKGEKVLETMLIRPFDHDPEYEKANLAMVGSDMTFHDNHLYFSDKHKGKYYLAKLNPHTAQIEEYQFLEEVKSNLTPPKFYDNKMFLLDSNNNLFIYQRE